MMTKKNDAAPAREEDDDLLTIPRVAEKMGVHRATVYRLIETGKLRAVPFLSERRIKRSEYRRYVDSLEPQTNEAQSIAS